MIRNVRIYSNSSCPQIRAAPSASAIDSNRDTCVYARAWTKLIIDALE